jgi:hypothetical protein
VGCGVDEGCPDEAVAAGAGWAVGPGAGCFAGWVICRRADDGGGCSADGAVGDVDPGAVGPGGVGPGAGGWVGSGVGPGAGACVGWAVGPGAGGCGTGWFGLIV